MPAVIDDLPAIAQLIRLKDHVLLSPVAWDTYERLLDDCEELKLRHTYDQGRLEIMTRSLEHEQWKGLFYLVVFILCDEWDLPFEDGGELTMRRQGLVRGLEPDQCFWIAQAAAITGKKTWDPDQDPAPDLFIEIEIRQTILDRIEILAALGIKEVWKYDGQTLEVGLLQGKGRYRWGHKSKLFPGLDIAEMSRQIGQAASLNKLAWSRQFRRWVRKNKPRTNGNGK